MPYKTIISKYIKFSLSAFLICFIGLQTAAQNLKIDGVAVVIGKNIVLDSDIDKFKQEIEIRSEGKIKNFRLRNARGINAAKINGSSCGD